MKLKKMLLKQLLKNEESKVIVINEAGEPLYVIVPYKAYLSKDAREFPPRDQQKRLTSEQLLDKINAELAQWYEQQNQKDLQDNFIVAEPSFPKGEEQEQLYLETIDE